MSVKNFQEWIASVRETRRVFDEATEQSRGLIEDSFNIFVDFLELIRPIINEEEDLTLALETLGVGTAHVLSSFVLLESGSVRDAGIILRSSLEWLLVSLQLIHDEESRAMWRATEDIDPATTPHTEFRVRSVMGRIRRRNELYAPVDLALAESIESQWRSLSRTHVHARAYRQVKSLLSSDGGIQLSGWLLDEQYKIYFKQYATYFLKAVSILLEAPTIKSEFGLVPRKRELGQFLNRYRRVEDSYLSYLPIELNVRNKAELEEELRRLGYPLDVSSLPDNAVFHEVKLIFSDDGPKLTVEYD